MNIKIRISVKEILFFFLLVMNLYYLYLVDPVDGTFGGVSVRDIAVGLAAVWGAFYWYVLSKKPNPKFSYRIWMISFLGLAVTSAIQSSLLTGQSFSFGFFPQRTIFVWALLYFPIRKSIYYGYIKIQSLKKIIALIVVLQLTLFIAQYLIREPQFLYVNTGFRNGTVRYYFSPVVMDLFFMFCLDALIKCRGRKRVASAVCIALILFEVMVVQQFRLTTMGLLVCGAFFVIFFRARKGIKFLYVLLAAIAAGVLFNTPLVQNVLDTVLTGSLDGGLLIREEGRRLYFNTLLRHPILGGGYPSSYYEPARQAAGMNSLIYLYDNGFFGLMYIYGSIGILWIVSLWGRLLRDGWQIRKKAKEMAYFLFPLFFIVTCLNEAHWYWEYGFVCFSLFLCLQESKMEELETIT